MKKSQSKKIAIIIVLIISCIIFTGISTVPRINHPETWMRAEMMQLKMATEQYLSTFKEYPIEGKQLHWNYETSSNNALLMNSLKGKNSRKQAFIKGDLSLDIKGNPYIFILDTNFDHEIEFNKKTYNEKVILYCYGLNGIDEKGGGDDISTID